MLSPRSEHEAKFVDYFPKMLARYAGITEAEYDRISRERREAKVGRRD